MNEEQLSTFWEHIEEFRKTLLKVIAVILVGTIVTAIFYRQIFSWVIPPVNGFDVSPLVILKPTEGITVAMKVCFWVGLIASSPIWLIQLLLFIVPALKKEEKKGLIPFLVAILLFFFLGVLFSHQITIPLANRYLSLWNVNMGENMWTLSYYVDYTFVLMFGHGLACELIVVLFFLVHNRWISYSFLNEKRRYFIVSAFIFSAVITPPDVITQLFLAIPLTLLYEVSIIYAKLRNKKLTNYRCKINNF